MDGTADRGTIRTVTLAGLVVVLLSSVAAGAVAADLDAADGDSPALDRPTDAEVGDDATHLRAAQDQPDRRLVDLTAYESDAAFADDWSLRGNPLDGTLALIYTGGEDPIPFGLVRPTDLAAVPGGALSAEVDVEGDWTVRSEVATVEVPDGTTLDVTVRPNLDGSAEVTVEDDAQNRSVEFEVDELFGRSG